MEQDKYFTSSHELSLLQLKMPTMLQSPHSRSAPIKNHHSLDRLSKTNGAHEPLSKRPKISPEKLIVSSPSSSSSSSPSCSTSCPLLNGLDDDALRAILVRTCASDHPALRACHERLRAVLDSPQFRSERASAGWAEVTVTLLSPRDIYKQELNSSDEFDEEYFQQNYGDLGFSEEGNPLTGTQQGKFVVNIDGNDAAGKGTFTLIPVCRDFYSLCDDIKEDLYVMACKLFNSHGKPRIVSIRKAQEEEHYEKESRAVMYLDYFEISDPAHRSVTTIGARALRLLLLNARLEERYSIVVYVPDSTPHYSSEDQAKRRAISIIRDSRLWRSLALDMGSIIPQAPSAEQMQKEQRLETSWRERVNTLCEFDMRQFLQTGFQQVEETVLESDCDFLYCLPSFLRRPLLTMDEALAAHIKVKPELPPSPVGCNAELLDLICRSSHSRTTLLHYINTELKKFARVDSSDQKSEEQVELEQLDAKVAIEVSRLVQEKGASITGSHALHAAAANFNTAYLELLLRHIPEASQAEALNQWNDLGYTPLQCCIATSAPGTMHDRYRVAEALISWGATTSVTNYAGYTALGCLHKEMLERQDIRDTLPFLKHNGQELEEGRNGMPSIVTRLEQLLSPETGPTAADDAVFEQLQDALQQRHEQDLGGSSDSEEEHVDNNEEE